jgi:glutamate racemase
VVEVIRPAVRRAAAGPPGGAGGGFCTHAPKNTPGDQDPVAAAPHLRVTTQACPRFVDFVEAGVTSGPELLAAAHEYLDPVVAAGVDTLILGCTHYPLLTGVISYVVGDLVTLVSSAEETAKDVYRQLVVHDLVRPDGLPQPQHRFETTGDPQAFAELGRRFLGPEVSPAQLVGDAR